MSLTVLWLLVRYPECRVEADDALVDDCTLCKDFRECEEQDGTTTRGNDGTTTSLLGERLQRCLQNSFSEKESQTRLAFLSFHVIVRSPTSQLSCLVDGTSVLPEDPTEVDQTLCEGEGCEEYKNEGKRLPYLDLEALYEGSFST